MSNSGGGIEALVNGLHQSGQLPIFDAGELHCNRKSAGKRRVFVTLYHIGNTSGIPCYEYRPIEKGGKLFKQFGISHRALALRARLCCGFSTVAARTSSPVSTLVIGMSF